MSVWESRVVHVCLPSTGAAGSFLSKGLTDMIEVVEQGSVLHYRSVFLLSGFHLVSHLVPQLSCGIRSVVIVRFLRGGLACVLSFCCCRLFCFVLNQLDEQQVAATFSSALPSCKAL